jgi:hypothetical protein
MLTWRRRLVRLLTWRRARNYALILLLPLYVVAWVYGIATGTPPLNSAGTPLSGDYIAFHAAGRLVLDGRASEMYDKPAVVGVQDALLGGVIPGFYDAFRNPPFFALLYAPLAALDLLPGFGVWSLLSLACLGLALKLLLEDAPALLRDRWRGLLILVLAFPPVYFGLIDGENAMVSLLLYALIFHALVRGQDRALGVWCALGLFKPQLFVVFPLIFVATRRWRALAAYVVTTVVLFAVSFVLVGADGMQAWLRILLEPESGNATVNGWRMTSAKAFFDALLPGSAGLSLALYALTSAVLVFGLIRTWLRRGADLAGVWVFTVLVAVLVDPHLVDYDLTVLVAAGVIGAALMPRLSVLIVALYLTTLLRPQLPAGDAAVLLTPLLLAICAVWVYRCLREPLAANVGEQRELVGAHS